MKKLLFIIPVLALILLNSCGNKGGITPLTAEDVTITVFGAGQDTTFSVPYEKAVEYERTYRACNDSIKHVKRHKPVIDTLVVTYMQAGKPILLVDTLDKLGFAVVRKSDLANLSAISKSKEDADAGKPVDVPNGGDDASNTKHGKGLFDSDTDFSGWGDAMLYILYALIIAALVIGGIWLLAALLGLLPNPFRNRNSGGDNPPNNTGGNNFSDHQQPIVQRQSGAGRYTPGPGVKTTVIEEKIERKTTHTYQ